MENTPALCPRCHGQAAETAGCLTCDGMGTVPAGFTVLAPEPLAEVRAPLAQWLSTLGGDPWLTEKLGQTDTDDPYRTAVVAGLGVRLWAPPAPKVLEIQEQLLATGTYPELERVRLWAWGLLPAEVRTLQDLTLAECDGLIDEIDWLPKSLAGDYAAQSLVWLCERRDNLEAVLKILELGGHRDRVDVLVDFIDEIGAEAVKGLEIPETEHLARSACFDLDRWWLPY